MPIQGWSGASTEYLKKTFTFKRNLLLKRLSGGYQNFREREVVPDCGCRSDQGPVEGLKKNLKLRCHKTFETLKKSEKSIFFSYFE